MKKSHPKGASLLQMIIRRAAAVIGGIGDSRSWMNDNIVDKGHKKGRIVSKRSELALI